MAVNNAFKTSLKIRILKLQAKGFIIRFARYNLYTYGTRRVSEMLRWHNSLVE